MSVQIHASKQFSVLSRKLVPLSRLEFAEYNPSGRVQLTSMCKLMDSMDMIGLIYPIISTPKYVVVDGHRRLTAATELGWRDIDTILTDQDPETVYASINITTRNMTGNDLLCIWLDNYKAVKTNTHKKFSDMAKVIGKPLVRKIADAGLTFSVFKVANRLCHYCDGSIEVPDVVNWLIDTRSTQEAVRAMVNRESPSVIMKAVKANRSLRFKVVVS